MKTDKSGRLLKTIVTAKIQQEIAAELDQKGHAFCIMNSISFSARLCKVAGEYTGGAIVKASLSNEGPFYGTDNVKTRRLRLGFSKTELWHALARCYFEAMDEKARRRPIINLEKRFDAAKLPQSTLDDLVKHGESAGRCDTYPNMSAVDIAYWQAKLDELAP